jgi:hypothetical protein
MRSVPRNIRIAVENYCRNQKTRCKAVNKILLFHIVSYGEKHPVYFDLDRIIKRETCEFTVRPKEEFSAQYHPETITYTGVTVGGVHTGGFTKNEAYYSASSKKTGYAELSFKDGWLSHTISEVIFSKDLQGIALCEIGHLFNNPEKNGFYLYKSSGIFSESMYYNAMRSRDLIAQSAIVNSNLHNYASIDTCSEVGKFLMRAIRGEFLTSEQRCEAVDILLAENETTAWVAAADLLQNPTTPQEKEQARRVAEKIGSVKIYKVGNRVYKDKSNYTKGLVNYIFKIATVPVIAICVILFFMSCMPGRDTSGYFIALIVIFGIWLTGHLISAEHFSPDKNSYYETQ